MVYFVQINVRCVVLVKDRKKGLLGFQGRGTAAQIPCGADRDAEVLLLAVGYPYSEYSFISQTFEFQLMCDWFAWCYVLIHPWEIYL